MNKKQITKSLCLWSFTISAIAPAHGEGVLNGFWSSSPRNQQMTTPSNPKGKSVVQDNRAEGSSSSRWSEIVVRAVGSGFEDPTAPEMNSIYYPVYLRSSDWSRDLEYATPVAVHNSRANALRYNELLERLSIAAEEKRGEVLTPEQRKKRNEDQRHKVNMTFGVVDEELARVLNILSANNLNTALLDSSVTSLRMLLGHYNLQSLSGESLAYQSYLRIHRFVSYVIQKLDTYKEDSVENEIELRALLDLLVNDIVPYQSSVRHLYIELGEKIFSESRFKKFHTRAIAVTFKSIDPGFSRNASHQLQALRVFQENMKSLVISYDHFSYIVSRIASMNLADEKVRAQVMRFMSFVAEFENYMSEEDKELHSRVIPPYFESDLTQTEKSALEDLFKKLRSSRTVVEQKIGMNELETLILGFGGNGQSDRAAQRAYKAFELYTKFNSQDSELQKRKYMFLARLLRRGDKTLIRSAQSFLLRDSLNQFQMTSSKRTHFLFEFMSEASGENWPKMDSSIVSKGRSEELINVSMEAALHVIGRVMPNQDEVAIERARLLVEGLNSNSPKIQTLSSMYLNSILRGTLQRLVEVKNQLGPKRANEFFQAHKDELQVLNQILFNTKLILKKMEQGRIQTLDMRDLLEILENTEFVSLLNMEKVKKLLAQINRIEKHQDQVVEIVASYVKQRLMDCGAILGL